VDHEPRDNNKGIYDLQFLCNMKIAVKATWKKTSIVQCTRLQSYGHTKTYCTRPFVHVKCGGAHNTTVCTKDPAIPATCALCGGAHPANYKGCYKGCNVYRHPQTVRAAPAPSPRLPTPRMSIPHVDTT
jgi:ribosomal protein S27E